MSHRMVKKSLQSALVFSCLSFAGTGTAAPVQNEKATTEEYVTARCARDGSDVFTEWSGNVYAAVPGEKHRLLFGIVGMNVGRCYKNAAGEWIFTSRELNYYVDPQTGTPLQQWQNPWTQETLPVQHVANSPVQHKLVGMEFPIAKMGNTTVFQNDFPLTYPNGLAKDPRMAEYSPEPLYQAIELFKFMVSTNALHTNSAPMNLTWDRMGPWLPWMKMGGRPGQLIYSARGAKVRSLESVSPVIQQEIAARMPLYAHAPRCFLQSRNETSWSYFAKTFDAFLRGERFPLPAPDVADICDPSNVPAQ